MALAQSMLRAKVKITCDASDLRVENISLDDRHERSESELVVSDETKKNNASPAADDISQTEEDALLIDS